jgi:hypothetical protein
MRPDEVRQALRIRRLAKQAESLIFQVIDTLNPTDQLDRPDWGAVQADLVSAQQHLQFCIDFARNSANEAR